MREKVGFFKAFLFLLGVFSGSIEAKPLPDSFNKQEKLEIVSGDPKDPLEPLNRSLLYVHRLVDGLFLKPAANFYSGVVPAPLQTGVGNVLGNLVAPLHMVNFAFQGEGKKAGRQFSRFLINSTLGIFGLFDVAASMGIKKEETSFGATFAKAGVPSGPYLIIPGLGPSDFREALGFVTSTVADPFNRVMIHEGQRNLIYVRGGIQTVHTRKQYLHFLESMEKNAVDYYQTLRSYYFEVSNKKESQESTGYSGPRPDADL